MLKLFEVENFRGFEKKLVFDLKAGRYDFNREQEAQGLVKNAIVYGENGVGKSALGLAIFDIIHHLTDKFPCSPSRLSPYRNLNSTSEEVCFKYVFLLEGEEIVYEYKKTSPTTLRWERLAVDGECLLECDYYSKSTPSLFLKEGLVGHLNVGLMDEGLSLVKYIYKNTLENTVPAITKLIKFCERMLWYRCLSDGADFAGYDVQTQRSLVDMLKEYGNLKEFEKFLATFGLHYHLGFEEVDNQTVLYAYYASGQKAQFWSVASTGTKALYLFYCWKVFAFKDVSLLFIDEFDAFLHYEASEALVKLLCSSQMQTILTSHNTSLLSNSLSRPDCNFILTPVSENRGEFVIKNLQNLTDREIRKVHNLEKMYRSGVFSNNEE
jgi:AAA15 family ATPase/GTPase